MEEENIISCPAWDILYNRLIYPISPKHRESVAASLPHITHILPDNKKGDFVGRYKCTECEDNVKPARGGKNRWYFSHYPGNLCTALGTMKIGSESSNHKLAKCVLYDLLRNKRSITILGAKCVTTFCNNKLAGNNIEYEDGDIVNMEYALKDGGRADVAVINNGANVVRYIFEIYNSSKTEHREGEWWEIDALEILGKDYEIKSGSNLTFQDIKRYQCGKCPQATNQCNLTVKDNSCTRNLSKDKNNCIDPCEIFKEDVKKFIQSIQRDDIDLFMDVLNKYPGIETKGHEINSKLLFPIEIAIKYESWNIACILLQDKNDINRYGEEIFVGAFMDNKSSICDNIIQKGYVYNYNILLRHLNRMNTTIFINYINMSNNIYEICLFAINNNHDWVVERAAFKLNIDQIITLHKIAFEKSKIQLCYNLIKIRLTDEHFKYLANIIRKSLDDRQLRYIVTQSELSFFKSFLNSASSNNKEKLLKIAVPCKRSDICDMIYESEETNYWNNLLERSITLHDIKIFNFLFKKISNHKFVKLFMVGFNSNNNKVISKICKTISPESDELLEIFELTLKFKLPNESKSIYEKLDPTGDDISTILKMCYSFGAFSLYAEIYDKSCLSSDKLYEILITTFNDKNINLCSCILEKLQKSPEQLNGVLEIIIKNNNLDMLMYIIHKNITTNYETMIQLAIHHKQSLIIKLVLSMSSCYQENRDRILKYIDDISISDKYNDRNLIEYILSVDPKVIVKGFVNNYQGDISTRRNYASIHSNFEQLVELHKEGISLEFNDNEGYTPLARAIINKNTKVVEYLLSIKCDTSYIVCHRGRDFTIKSLASIFGSREIIDLLRESS